MDFNQKIKMIAKTYLTFNSVLLHTPLSHNPSKIQNFCFKVETAYLSLSAPLKRIINNDFFYQEYPGWWKLLYSKNKYLKLRDKAIKEFMEIYYEIN